MSLRMVSSLASRMGSLVPSVTKSGSFRQASRDARNWTGLGQVHRVPDHRRTPMRRREAFEDEPTDMDDVEDRIQAMETEARKKLRKVKFHQVRRLVEPKGAPERKLSWDAMQQIRYLKQQQPEEWTVERLAESFDVSTDVIFRVLRSKFLPTPERKDKQDAKVQARLHQQQSLPAGVKQGQGRPQLPRPITPAMLPAGGAAAGALVVHSASRSLMPTDDGARTPATRGGALASRPNQNRALLPVQASLRKPSVAEEDATVDNVLEAEDEQDEEEEWWDEYVFTEQELEELMPSMKPPSPVTQNGNEFFDSNGVFLYSI